MQRFREQFCAAVHRAGLTPPLVIEADGKLHRFPTNGQPSDDAGWYVLHGDGIPAGAFGDWRTRLSKTWRADLGRKLTPAEKSGLRARTAAALRARDMEEVRRGAESRVRAEAIWQASQPATEDHPYLQAKGVKSHGLRMNEGALVVPMSDGEATQSLQFIAIDGAKRFLAGARLTGLHHLIGQPEAVLCIAEGFATAASIHEATGYAVAVAFGAGNLMAVGQCVRQRCPESTIIICADDDAATKGNPGLTRAEEAARAAGALLAKPDFGAERPADATDFNDLARLAGLEAVRACVDRAAPVPIEDAAEVVVRRLSDVKMEPIRWLWPGRFARGKVSMIAGNPGLGKSQITASLAAVVTKGDPWPVEGGTSSVGSVIFLSAEDDAADTIKPRLLAAGADPSRCYVLDAVKDRDSDGEVRIRSFNLQNDLNRLAGLLEQIGDAVMVVIDPISAYMGSTDSHKNADVRAVLAPLAALAARFSVAVVCVSHLNKAGSGEALMRVTGSLAFVAAARAAYVVARDKDIPHRRLFLPLKNNIGTDQTGLAFSLESSEPEPGIQTSRVMWEPELVTVTADEAMRPAEMDDERSQREEIADWLRDLLSLGRMKSQDVQSKAKQSGLAWRTVQRVGKDLGVTMKREGFGPDTVTYWSLPAVAPSGASHATD